MLEAKTRDLGWKTAFLFIIVVVLYIILFQTNHAASAVKTSAVHQKALTNSYVTVTATDLNVRVQGNANSHIINVVHKGDRLTLIQTINNWDQIKCLDNKIGWVSNNFVLPASSFESNPATVIAKVLNVRKSPSLSGSIIGELKLGTKINIYEEQNGWAKMVDPSGKTGWIYEFYVQKTSHQKSIVIKAPQSTTTDVLDQTINNVERSGTQFMPIHSSTKSNLRTQSISTTPVKLTKEPLKGKTIVLDPGHGGIDNGTTSPFTGTHEKNLTLETAEAVKKKLMNAGAKVFVTRNTDTLISLQKRVDLSNSHHADAFISFHYNWSSDPSVNGLSDFFYNSSKDSLLATALLDEVSQATKLIKVSTKFDNLHVLRTNSQPSTLIELGFLSNQQEDTVIESAAYRDHVAQGVYQGLINYFAVNK